MDVCQQCFGIAGAMDESYLRLRVMQQQADQLTCRITCAADNTYSYHIIK